MNEQNLNRWLEELAMQEYGSKAQAPILRKALKKLWRCE